MQARADTGPPVLLTVGEVAAQLAMPEWSVRKIIRMRQMGAINVGRGRRVIYRVEPCQVQAYLDAHRTQPAVVSA